MQGVKWTKQTILDAIKDKQVNGVVSSVDTGMTVSAMARRHFGSFSEACEVAGLVSSSKRPSNEVCSVDCCDLKVRSKHSEYCEKHYARMRRKGTTSKSTYRETFESSNGYIRRQGCSDHPLSVSGSFVYEHRRVLFDSIGHGPHSCHWCGSSIDWSGMHVDHIDENKKNNHISNLVPSCPKCNTSRNQRNIKTMRKKGRLITHDGITLCISDWARMIGVAPASIAWRLDNGWPIGRAVTEGRGVTGPTSKKIRKPDAVTLEIIEECREALEARKG